MSPISSRNSVPKFAASKRPTFLSDQAKPANEDHLKTGQ